MGSNSVLLLCLIQKDTFNLVWLSSSTMFGTGLSGGSNIFMLFPLQIVFNFPISFNSCHIEIFFDTLSPSTSHTYSVEFPPCNISFYV